MNEKENKNSRSFGVNGAKYKVRRPTFKEIVDANEARSKTFNESLKRGDMLRDQLDAELRKRELWNDDREARYQSLRQTIIDGEYTLSKGGIKLTEAKDIALEMSDARSEMVEMLSSRSDLDSNTCEGKADAVRFNYLFSCCLVYEETEAPYFENGLQDYLLSQDEEVSVRGATEFYYLMSQSNNMDETLPENKFLKSFDLVDKDLRLIDKGGRLVDRKGKHVDGNGNLINWINETEYELVDTKGRKVKKDGNFDVEFSPFLDDGGKPIAQEEDEPKPKKRTRRKTKAETEKPEKSEATEAEQVEEPEVEELEETED